MADFERMLMLLAERGTHVGPEEMIERVEAGLAEEPVVAVIKQRKGWDMSVDSEKGTGSGTRGKGPLIGVAVFMLVIVAGGLILWLANVGGGAEPEPIATTTTAAPTTTLDPEAAADFAVIEKYLIAWHHGDVETALPIINTTVDESPGVAGWSRYEGAMNAEIDVDCTTMPATEHEYQCEVAYANDLHRAVEAGPHTIEWSARVDGATLEVTHHLDPIPMSRSWDEWEQSAGLAAESPCSISGPPTPECADFQQQHLEQWANWHIANK